MFPTNVGEMTDVIHAARLGLAAEAAWMVHDRLMLRYSDPAERAWGHLMRFPGFYGVMEKDFNWFPDAEQSDVASTALQWMLLALALKSRRSYTDMMGGFGT